MTLDAKGGGSTSRGGGLDPGWPEVREGEASFHALFETSPIPMWIYAVDDLRFLRVNAAAVHGYGWSEAEFLGRTLIDIRPEADKPRVAALARVERIDPWLSGPFRHLDATGRVRIVETATCPVRYRGCDARLAVVWNVTDRHGAAQALRDAQRLARIGTWRLEGGGDGLPQASPGPAAPEPHLVLSAELAQMLGMGAETRLPMTAVGRFVHPEDLDAVSAAAAASAANGVAFDHEFRFQRPDGRPMHLRCAGQPGRATADGQASPAGTLLEGFCQDVTDQREAEAALRQAEKLSAIGQLTGGVAHDFNNLLTVVSANLQLALESVGDGETRRALKAAAAAAERGAALTSQLLSFARRQPLRPRALALAPFLDSFAGLVSRLMGDTHPLRVSVDPAGLGALCDPAQFESALLNLVLNARDAMPGGGPIRIEAAPEPADLVAVRVHDTGTGMSPEIKARVLEPFFTTKPPGKGTGLGLSMALGFARQSGGDLRVESTLGRGSTMSLLLPRATIASAERPGADLAAGLPSIAVLIVEDDPAVRAVATTIFQRFGAQVAAVESGEEALALLDGGHPCDLLFSDIVLGPGMDGFALGRAVRTAHPRVAVLFTSGYNEASEECARSPELSGCDLLPKPYAIGPLRAAVLRALAAVR